MSSIFQKSILQRKSLLTQNMNEHWKSHTVDQPDKEVETNAALNKSQVWRKHCLKCLIQIHLSPLASPYLVKYFQSRVWHVCNPLSLTWNLGLVMHDWSGLTHGECELNDKSYFFPDNSSRENVSWAQSGRTFLLWKHLEDDDWRKRHKRRTEIVREALSLSLSLVCWWRDTRQWGKEL